MVTTQTDVDLLEWPIGTKVESYPPTANGTTNQFTRGGVNTGANWSQVSDIPLATGAADQYVSSATAGHIDQYQHSNILTSTDVVYHIQALCFWFDTTTPQQILIGADTYSVATIEGGSARYGVAHKIYANNATLSAASFNALEFGVKKLTAGGTTLFSGQEFLEVLTGPPNIIEEDLPDPGDPTAWSVTAAYDAIGGLQYEQDDLTFVVGTLGFRLGNQGVEINVPAPWQVERIDVGSRDEQTS
jgi:hypothetical protein